MDEIQLHSDLAQGFNPFILPESAEDPFPRGVKPEILLNQIEVTMPYLWDMAVPNAPEFRYLHHLKKVKKQFDAGGKESLFFDHAKYYELCVSAHYATVGTFVPTDVDNQIRWKLWYPTLPETFLLEMTELIMECKTWRIEPVTTRHIEAPTVSTAPLCGHDGEWFTIAAGCYSALRRKHQNLSHAILSMIQTEIEREANFYRHFKKERDGISLLKTCAFLAHNLGDLKRVIDMWNLTPEDPLFQSYEATLFPDFMDGVLIESGDLYKAFMAPENHRHLPLRKAKVLRKSPDFLLGVGPFFDDWGRVLSKHPLLTVEDLGDIAECLIDGFNRLENSVGYARALCGLETHYPGGASAIYKELPTRIEKSWKTGPIRQVCSIPQERFEAQWGQKAMKFVKEYRLKR